ncbi:MAG: class I SAM-dependent methyltransferase [bacterium]
MSIYNWIVEAIRNPRELSTIFPSSRFLARKIADQIDFGEPCTIAELGPADGALTKPIVERMDPDTQLLLVELVEGFCEDLADEYDEHPKRDAIEILNRSAENLDSIIKEHDIEGLDYVVSGLPLTTLPDGLSNEIIRTVYDCLKPSGRYIQFQYSQDYKENIEEVFGPVELHRVWLNIFPAWVYVADKSNSPGD